jgi:hypothetical protein
MGHSGKSARRCVETFDYRKVIICFLCDEPILSSDEKFHLAIDRPSRLNLIVHRKCYKQLSSDEIQELLSERLIPRKKEHSNVKEKPHKEESF